MVKSFVELKQADQVATLELSAYALTPAEHKSVRTELDAFEQKADEGLELAVLDYTYIDADSIRAELRGEYNAVMSAMSKLEASGWTWNQEDQDA